MPDKPELYFRRREKGASVFRIETGQHGRMETVQIAVLKPNGDIKVANNQTLAPEEKASINAWHEERLETQPARDMARLDNLVGEMNAVSQWLQSDATPEQVAGASKELLLSIHDLRAMIVKQLSRG